MLRTGPPAKQRLGLKPHKTEYLWCGTNTRLNNWRHRFALSQEEVIKNVLGTKVYPAVYLSIHRSILPSHSHSSHLMIHTSVLQFFHLSLNNTSILPSIHPSISLSPHPQIDLLIQSSFPFIHPAIHPAICWFIYLSYHSPIYHPSTLKKWNDWKTKSQNWLFKQYSLPSPPLAPTRIHIDTNKCPPRVCFHSCDHSGLWDVGPVTVSLLGETFFFFTNRGALCLGTYRKEQLVVPSHCRGIYSISLYFFLALTLTPWTQ